ncbi:MAG: NUDIX domain-containing protein [Lachnospiraceae bacterium]|nr:NUDIX domain-containing protein [Clostridium sp.]MDY4820483.1 NUDIX domain-containing protein [Lachnospiraceae bacterium]
MEKWDLYTKYREKTGKEHIRGEEIPEGLYHLVVHVWIRNSRGEYLLSRRAADRPTYPFFWETVGGSVLQGETSIEGAVREVKEEVGITLSPESGQLAFTKIRDTVNGEKFRDILDVWVFYYDGEADLTAATTKEVAECKWLRSDQIYDLFQEQKLVPTLDYFFSAFSGPIPHYRDIIGKWVSGKVDRPLGMHRADVAAPSPKADMVYAVNYGYIDGVKAADGEEQDAYIFGTEEPLTTFEGKVIKVYHRFNDIEDKWIVSLTGEDIPDEKILGDIAFQEQYFYGKLYDR